MVGLGSVAVSDPGDRCKREKPISLGFNLILATYCSGNVVLWDSGGITGAGTDNGIRRSTSPLAMFICWILAGFPRGLGSIGRSVSFFTENQKLEYVSFTCTLHFMLFKTLARANQIITMEEKKVI